MSERQNGWYWVKVIKDGSWGCFKWNGRAWWEGAREYPECLFDVVGPRIPTPDEPWQCVPVEPTERMVEAACEEVAPIDREYERSSRRWDWRMMLEAAPKPDTQP